MYKGNAFVGEVVGEIVIIVAVAVVLGHAIVADGISVVLAVPNEPKPAVPTRGNVLHPASVAAAVVVQIPGAGISC